MNNSELRNMFAAFAMLKMNWDSGNDREKARECFQIADAMVEASLTSLEDSLGIVAIKKRKKPVDDNHN